METVKKQIIEAYQFRHACKEFDESKKISEEDFSFILETGRLSPSSFGFEPWRFLVVQNPEIREKIKQYSWGAQGQLPTASHIVLILARTQQDMRYDAPYIDNFMRTVQELPEDVIKMKGDFYHKFQDKDFSLLENERAMFDWACKQTYIALGNMMTAAAQIGIDSCPMEGFDQRALDELLDAEGVFDHKQYGVACMVAFGYRKNQPRGKTRQKTNQIVEWLV